MTLWDTEVPPGLRGRGIAATFARTALEYARDENLKLDDHHFDVCVGHPPVTVAFSRSGTLFSGYILTRYA
jgi:predicted GNAT family acetyltransferase